LISIIHPPIRDKESNEDKTFIQQINNDLSELQSFGSVAIDISNPNNNLEVSPKVQVDHLNMDNQDYLDKLESKILGKICLCYQMPPARLGAVLDKASSNSANQNTAFENYSIGLEKKQMKFINSIDFLNLSLFSVEEGFVSIRLPLYEEMKTRVVNNSINLSQTNIVGYNDIRTMLKPVYPDLSFDNQRHFEEVQETQLQAEKQGILSKISSKLNLGNSNNDNIDKIDRTNNSVTKSKEKRKT